MLSKITGGPTKLLFTTTVLNKHPVKYYQCEETGFIQTEEPFWLDEAYSSAITKLDIGLPDRNIRLSNIAEKLLLKYFDGNAKFLDYAGGYGLFTRLMRDKGFDYYNTDKYCENIFAEYFDLKDTAPGQKFELVTSFEVLEHLVDPYAELKEIFAHTDSLLFTTTLLTKPTFKDASEWWYFIPETGQHIALYTEASLQYIAQKFQLNFYTNGIDLHLFTKKKFDENPFAEKRESFLIRKARKYVKKYDAEQYPKRETLLQKDWEMISKKLS